MPLLRSARTQKQIARQLEEEMKDNRLPQSILFSGSPYTSRMTTALELALCLSGEEDKFDTLESANIITLSSRESTLRIRALRNLYEKDMTSSAFLNLVHEVRVMLLSCHEALYTNSDKDVFAAASELSSLLMEEPSPDDRQASSEFLSAFDKAYDLFISKKRKSSLFTIDQIRLIQSYLQQNSEQNKIVILENIEDVSTGAVNSILKLLEEPPEGAYIILISQNAGRIIDTILSRVRHYEFPSLSPECQRTLIRDSYRRDGSDLEEFFLISSGLDLDQLNIFAEEFIYALLVRKKGLTSEEMNSLCAFLDSFSAWRLFLEKCVSLAEDGFRQGKLDAFICDRMLGIISRCYNNSQVYAQNRRVMLENIHRGILAL